MHSPPPSISIAILSIFLIKPWKRSTIQRVAPVILQNHCHKLFYKHLWPLVFCNFFWSAMPACVQVFTGQLTLKAKGGFRSDANLLFPLFKTSYIEVIKTVQGETQTKTNSILESRCLINKLRMAKQIPVPCSSTRCTFSSFSSAFNLEIGKAVLSTLRILQYLFS